MKSKNINKISVEKAMVNAFQDKKLCQKTSDLLKKMVDGEPVNKNPIKEIPNPELRLYTIANNIFETIDELLHYCRINNKSIEGLRVLDYYRQFAGCSDVIRSQDCYMTNFYTAVDEDGFGVYNNERSIYRGEFIWEYEYGSIKSMYKIFRDKGIIFENDIYAKEEEKMQHILKYCKENNLFNIGKNKDCI